MVTLESHVLGLASFGERLQTDVVLVVEVGSVEWKQLAVRIELLEPGGRAGDAPTGAGAGVSRLC